MAKPVKLKKGQEFVFKAATGGAQQGKYPWDEWLNGELQLIERSDVNEKGELVEGGVKRDFEVDIDAMPGKLKKAARMRYKVCQISRLDADGKKLENGLIIRARPMTNEEKVTEDETRAEEKELDKERRKKRKQKGAATTPDQPATTSAA